MCLCMRGLLYGFGLGNGVRYDEGSLVCCGTDPCLPVPSLSLSLSYVRACVRAELIILLALWHGASIGASACVFLMFAYLETQSSNCILLRNTAYNICFQPIIFGVRLLLLSQHVRARGGTRALRVQQQLDQFLLLQQHVLDALEP